MECCSLGKGEWRWYVKLTEHRGPSTLTCYGWVVCSTVVNEPCLPHCSVAGVWNVSTGNGFVVQSTVTCTLSEDLACPTSLYDKVIAKICDINRELTREPIAGAVVITGATGPRGHLVNGVFEPVLGKSCNDMPVYRNKDAPDYWMECCQMGAEWKWYVKLTEHLGENNTTCYGYSQCAAFNRQVALPQDMPLGNWSVSTGNGFNAMPATTLTLYHSLASTPIPTWLTTMCDEKNAKMAMDFSRKPLDGSFIIAGASGPRASMVSE
jgi:hypothetical protein